MLKPIIEKGTVIYLKDCNLTFGKENKASRWWCRYNTIGSPVWASVKRKELLTVIVYITTLNELLDLLRNLSPSERYREDIDNELRYQIKDTTDAINRALTIEDASIHEEVKFLFDTTAVERTTQDFIS